MIGSQDILIGVAIMVFLFGAKKLPELAASLGKSMKEFKKAAEGEQNATESPPPTTPPAVPAPPRSLCAACQTALEADWKHCPRCGAVIRATAPPT